MARFSVKHYRPRKPVLALPELRSDTIPPAKGFKPILAEMNGTEAKYAASLAQHVADGLISAWWYQALSWRIGPNAHYRPDFVVLRRDGVLELHEVKARASSGGFGATEASLVRVKAVAGHSPFRVVVVWPRKGGGWESQVISRAEDP